MTDRYKGLVLSEQEIEEMCVETGFDEHALVLAQLDKVREWLLKLEKKHLGHDIKSSCFCTSYMEVQERFDLLIPPVP